MNVGIPRYDISSNHRSGTVMDIANLIVFCCFVGRYVSLDCIFVGAGSVDITQAGTDEAALVRAPADVLLAGGGRAGYMYALGVQCKVAMQPHTYCVSSLYDVCLPGQKRPWSLRGLWRT